MDFLTGMPPEPKPGSKKAVTHKSMSESQWVSHLAPLSHSSSLTH